MSANFNFIYIYNSLNSDYWKKKKQIYKHLNIKSNSSMKFSTNQDSSCTRSTIW